MLTQATQAIIRATTESSGIWHVQKSQTMRLAPGMIRRYKQFSFMSLNPVSNSGFPAKSDSIIESEIERNSLLKLGERNTPFSRWCPP